MTVQAIPAGYHTVTPYLIVDDVAKLLAFLEAAFGATVQERQERPDGVIAHAQVQIGTSKVMMGSAGSAWKARSNDCIASFLRSGNWLSAMP